VSVTDPTPPVRGIPSLVSSTIRRTIVIGWRYIAIGTAISLLLTAILIFQVKSGSTHAAFSTAYPLELPIFAVLGSVAGLMTFTADRTKGVYEYLIAYGIRPGSLFANTLLATVAMVALILGVSLGLGLGIGVSQGVVLTQTLAKSLALYTLPVSFAGGLFTATVGMMWTSISSPRMGMNSPVGIAPMFGVAPVILVLIVAEAAPASDFYYVTGGAAAVIIVIVVGLLSLSARLMSRERFLSPI
jgi:hypothetical protein